MTKQATMLAILNRGNDMQVPYIKITKEHMEKATNSFKWDERYSVDICNKAIEIALAEQANQPSPISDLSQVFIPKRKDAEQSQEQYITAVSGEPVAYHYKYSTDISQNVWGVGYHVPNIATEYRPLYASPQPLQPISAEKS